MVAFILNYLLFTQVGGPGLDLGKVLLGKGSQFSIIPLETILIFNTG